MVYVGGRKNKEDIEKQMGGWDKEKWREKEKEGMGDWEKWDVRETWISWKKTELILY